MPEPQRTEKPGETRPAAKTYAVVEGGVGVGVSGVAEPQDLWQQDEQQKRLNRLKKQHIVRSPQKSKLLPWTLGSK
jgi:hypothetical protein